jgi:hypothetical protein
VCEVWKVFGNNRVPEQAQRQENVYVRVCDRECFVVMVMGGEGGGE